MKNNGIVYFFKHNEVDAVKIGLTHGDGILRRFNVFKTYSPFGAECIGYIKTDDCVKLEKHIHLKLNEKRIQSKNEWFSISKDEAVILILTNKGIVCKSELRKKPELLIDNIKHIAKKDAIVKMFKDGYRRREISNLLYTQYSYVSKIINDSISGATYQKIYDSY
jgi:hypothetical protein